MWRATTPECESCGETHATVNEAEWVNESRRLCPSCWSYFEVLVDSGTLRDPVKEKLDQLDDLADADDPTILVQDQAEGTPVVALVDGELRMLSSRLIYPRAIEAEDVRVAWSRHGEPRLAELSDAGAGRFDESHFLEVRES